jgi:AcrR family transcriptional regulator
MPRAGLTTGAIVEIALGAVDDHGLAGLTLTTVAERAGVATPALYKHVRNLADLQQLIAARVAGEVTADLEAAVMGRSGDDAIRALAATFRAYATRFPERYAAIVAAPQPGTPAAEAAGRMLDVFLAVLRGYGLEGSQAVHATRALRSACHGFAMLQAGGGFGLPEDLDASYDLLVDMLVSGLSLASRLPA